MGFEVIGDQLTRHLNDDHLSLLSDLFETMPSYVDGIDVLRFNVKHHHIEHAIHDLYRRDLIQRRPGPDFKNVYRPSLLALPLIESDATRTLEATCDGILQYLHSAFKGDPYVQVTVGDIASQVSIDEDVLLDALRYLRDMPLGLIAVPDDATFEQTDNVPIIQSIMRYPTLLDVYKTLLQWATADSGELPFVDAGQEPITTPLVAYVDEILEVGNNSGIDAEIARVLRELRLALLHELRTLSAIGIRTVIDMIVDEQSQSDLGTFKNKLQWLKDQQLVSELDRKHLLEVIDLGSSAAHRGYTPGAEHLKTALMVLNHLVQRVYTMPSRIDALKKDKPNRSTKRRPRKNRPKG